jgi:uncharacterized protein (TIGR02001 family)
MRRYLLLAACFAASPAFAAQPEQAPESAFSVSGEAALVSDYRFRGVSLTRRNPALQADITLEHASGFYAGAWASTIEEMAGGPDVEIDPYLGYSVETSSGLTADIMLSYYMYPAESALNYAEATATFTRPFGQFTPKLELNYAPRQSALVDEEGQSGDNFYGSASMEYVLPGSPLTLAAQLGFEDGIFDYRPRGGKLDWSLGARLELNGIAFGLFYLDTNVSVPDDEGQELAGATALASLTFGF